MKTRNFFLTRGRRRLAFALAACLAFAPAAMQASAQQPPLTPEGPPVSQEAGVPVEASSSDPDGAPALTRADVDDWLDGFMPIGLENARIVGAVVTVVKDGEILTSRGYGYSDLEAKTPVDPARTLFRPGSISKTFTWTAVMQLVEQGKLDLDTDVNEYLDFEIPEAFGAPITLRHALTHTPGFEEAIKSIIVEDESDYLELGDYLKNSMPSRVFPPGETPAYSNYATSLAGYIVARVSGMSFDDYIEENVFAPVGMTRSTFRQPLPADIDAEMSGGYLDSTDGEAQFFEFVTPAPAGSLSATGEDMGRFMIAHLNEGGPLLRPETAREMHETYDAHYPPLNAMALGFYQQNKNDLRSVGHGGDTIFFHSDMHLFLDRNVGIFVSFNSAGKEGATSPLRQNLARMFAERYFPEARTPDEPVLDTAREHGEMVVGVYDSSRRSVTNFLALFTGTLGQIAISLNEDDELVTALGGEPDRWREVEPFVWRKVGGPERLAVVQENGKVTAVSFEPISPFMELQPAPVYRSSALLTPLISAALAVLIATALLWPISAAVRRRYKTPFALSGRAALAYRLVRVGAVLVLVYLVGWVMVFAPLMNSLSVLTPALDPQVRLMQIAQVVLYAALALAIWNAVTVWRGGRGWFAMLWSGLIPLAIAIVIWFAAVGGLLSFSLTF